MGMGGELGSLFVRIGADITGLQKGLSQAGQGLAGWGQAMTAAGKVWSAAITAPIMGIGAIAVKAANTMKESMIIIQRHTTATGETLKGLGESAKKVFTQVPEAMDQVSSALSLLYARTGLTGTALEKLTRQELELARISGTDVKEMVDQTTKMFGDWGIATDKQSGALDYLMKVSKATGIPIARLAQAMWTYGTPLRQMGFTFESTAVMMAKFEKEGVRTELIIGGLKIALGKIYAAGKDPVKAFTEIIDSIKNATTAAEAGEIALKAFGRRAGPDMVGAIREGKLDLQDLINLINNSKDTVNKTAEDTRTFGESMTIAYHKVLVAMAPLGDAIKKLFDNPSTIAAMDKIIGVIAKIVEGFANLSPEVQTAIVVIAAVVAAIGPLLLIVGQVAIAIAGLGMAGVTLGAFVAVVGTFAAVTAAIIGVGAAVYEFIKYWDDMKFAVTDAVNMMLATVGENLPAVGAFLNDLGVISDDTKDKVNKLSDKLQNIKPPDPSIVKFFSDIPTAIPPAVPAPDLSAWEQTKVTVGAIWDDIMEGLSNAMMSIANKVTEWQNDLANRMDMSTTWHNVASSLSSLGDIWRSVLDIVRSYVDNAANWITATWSSLSSTVGSIWASITSTISLWARAAYDAVVSQWRSIVSTLGGIMSSLNAAIASGWRMIYQTAVSYANSVINAITPILLDGIERLTGWISQKLSALAAMFRVKAAEIRGAGGHAESGNQGWGPEGAAESKVFYAGGETVGESPPAGPPLQEIPPEEKRKKKRDEIYRENRERLISENEAMLRELENYNDKIYEQKKAAATKEKQLDMERERALLENQKKYDELRAAALAAGNIKEIEVLNQQQAAVDERIRMFFLEQAMMEAEAVKAKVASDAAKAAAEEAKKAADEAQKTREGQLEAVSQFQMGILTGAIANGQKLEKVLADSLRNMFATILEGIMKTLLAKEIEALAIAGMEWWNPLAWVSIGKIVAKYGIAITALRAIKFHTGGMVGSPLGPPRDVPAILQTGEMVLSRAQVAALRGGRGGTQITTYVGDINNAADYDRFMRNLGETIQGAVGVA